MPGAASYPKRNKNFCCVTKGEPVGKSFPPLKPLRTEPFELNQLIHQWARGIYSPSQRQGSNHHRKASRGALTKKCEP